MSLLPLFLDVSLFFHRFAPSARAKSSRQTSAGFTLVELLVSMTVTLLLIVALLQVFNAAASTWRHGEAQADAYREARGALQMMARDLGGTLQADYGPPSSGATLPSPALPTLVLQRLADPTPDASGPRNEEVYCLTNIPNAGSSTLCAVGYFCQWMPDAQPGVPGVPRAYALMRRSLNSDQTSAKIQTAGQARKNPLTFDDFFTGSVSGSTASPLPEQLAAYVWDLRFRIDTTLGVPDGNDPTPKDHANLLAQGAMPRSYGGDVASQPYPTRLPSYVEIRFKALSETAGRRLENSGNGVTKATWRDTDTSFQPAGLYQQIILPNAQQFVLRVPLNNAGPEPTPTPPPSS